jgi:hypothetical protein
MKFVDLMEGHHPPSWREYATSGQASEVGFVDTYEDGVPVITIIQQNHTVWELYVGSEKVGILPKRSLTLEEAKAIVKMAPDEAREAFIGRRDK